MYVENGKIRTLSNSTTLSVGVVRQCWGNALIHGHCATKACKTGKIYILFFIFSRNK